MSDKTLDLTPKPWPPPDLDDDRWVILSDGEGWHFDTVASAAEFADTSWPDWVSYIGPFDLPDPGGE